MKALIIIQNLFSSYITQDRIQENILKVIRLKDKKGDKAALYHLGM